MAKKGDIPSENVRKVKVRAMVDSGAMTLTISEEIVKQLGLKVHEQIEVTLANGSFRKCDYVGPVGIRFENRTACCRALVHPDRPHRAQMKVK